MTPRLNAHKVVGWGTVPGDATAHYWIESRLGIVAISLCWLHAKPKAITPAPHTERCPVCELMETLRRSPDTMPGKAALKVAKDSMDRYSPDRNKDEQ